MSGPDNYILTKNSKFSDPAQAAHDLDEQLTMAKQKIAEFEQPTEQQAKCFHDYIAANNYHIMELDFSVLWDILIKCRKGEMP